MALAAGRSARTRSASPIQPNRSPDIGYAVDAAGLLQPGLAVSAYMTAHSEAAALLADALRARLTALGLPVRAVVRVDGDGRPEVIALLPAGVTVGGWVTTRQAAGPWRALTGGGPRSLTTIGAPQRRPNGMGALPPLVISGGAQPPAPLAGFPLSRADQHGRNPRATWVVWPRHCPPVAVPLPQI